VAGVDQTDLWLSFQETKKRNESRDESEERKRAHRAAEVRAPGQDDEIEASQH
jgi:hypothetical protein